jgi:hypothetical protein
MRMDTFLPSSSPFLYPKNVRANCNTCSSQCPCLAAAPVNALLSLTGSAMNVLSATQAAKQC